MNGKDIIKYNVVGKGLGFSKEHLRKGRKVKDQDKQHAIEELENFCDNWAEKYTKTK
jgi:hypothetical protein